MAKSRNDAAVLHLILGAAEKGLKKLEKDHAKESPGEELIPPGHHDCGSLQVTLTTPPHASVDRAEGSEGAGYELGEPAQLSITPVAVALYIEKVRSLGPPTKGAAALQRWEECIRQAQAWKGKADDLLPAEAFEALALVQADQPVVEPDPKKTPKERMDAGEVLRATPRKRIGEGEVEIEIKRVRK